MPKRKFKVEGLAEDKLNPKGFGGMCSRATVLFKRENGKVDFEKGIPTIATTDAPAIVIDWDRWEIVREVLPMRYCEMPNNDKTPLLDSHSRISVEKVKGSAKNWSVNDRELNCLSFISETEPNIRKKIEEDHIDSVSIGYETNKNYTVEIPKGAAVTIDGVQYRNDFEDGYTFLVRTWWKVHELSLVPIGADEAAKFRNAINDPALKNLLDEFNEQNKSVKELLIKINERDSKMPPVENTTEAPEKSPEEILKEDRERAAEIRKIAKQFKGRVAKIDETAEEYCQSGRSVAEFNAYIVTQLRSGEEFSTPPSNLDLGNKDKKNYSIWNLVRAVVEKNPDLAGLEIEASREIAKRVGPSRSANSFYVEYGHLKREITIGAPGTAGNLVAVELRAGNFLDLLYNRMVFGKLLNVKMINGLVGDLDFPRKTSSSTGYYVGESEAATESDINFGLQRMSPKTVSALIKYSRKTSLQATPEMEGLVLEDVINSIKLRADYAFLNDDGTNDTPLGLLLVDGVQTFDGTNFTFDKAVDMETLLDNANVDMDNAVFLAHPLVKGELRKRKIETGQTAKLWEKDMLIERRAFSTKQMPNSSLFLIEPSEVIVGTWGILEIQINRLNDDGGVKVIPFWSHDIINRRSVASVKTTAFS